MLCDVSKSPVTFWMSVPFSWLCVWMSYLITHSVLSTVGIVLMQMISACHGKEEFKKHLKDSLS